MTPQSLSTIVRRLHTGGGVPPASALREAAATRAVSIYGFETADAHPSLINCAALALSMPRLTLHRLSAGAARMVDATDLHSLPGEPPPLIRGAWLLEARRPEEPLFGSTSSLGGYVLDDAIYLIGLQYPDGVAVARWTPHWAAEELEAGIVRDESPLISDVDAHHAWAREAARFAIVLALLLTAENSPVLVDEERSAAKRSPAGPGGEWTVRRVYLSRLIPAAHRTPQPDREAAGLTGRTAAVVGVRGHIKRQPYGPRASLRRWIYVEGYSARRWVAPKPLRIEVR